MKLNMMERFIAPRDIKTTIKVVGVGGGGGNAVTHMYREGIQDVSFVLCNTDSQALSQSEVPVKICLGHTVTEGLGAGNKPKRAEMAALESENEIRAMLSDGTKMVFITAGMGGGTGTGAAPVIARIAKEMNILTVGIVTIPFKFEGKSKIKQALSGVEKIGKNVDALLVVNNERLCTIYHDFTLMNAFKKVDNTLTIAARSIAEIITLTGHINLDFADVETTMKDGGVALMSNGYGEGEDRMAQAIEEAFHSPLLNNNNVFNAKKILFNIVSSSAAEIQMKELDFINDFMERFEAEEIEVIWGTAVDESLGEKIKFTVLATGFGLDNIPEIKKNRQDETDLQDDIINEYYGVDKKSFSPASPTSIVVLTWEEMENEQIITMLEENPTYNRDSKLITQLRKKIAKELAGDMGDDTLDRKKPASSSGGNTTVIHFNKPN